jgi:hypothetical protein
MLHENTALFVELTEEQTEVVTGGSYGSYPGADYIDDHLNSFYKQHDQATILEVTQASGPSGSATVQKFANVSKDIDTGAYKDFTAWLH